MTTISEMKAHRYKENEAKKYSRDIKKLRKTHSAEYSKELKQNKASLSHLKDAHLTKSDNLELELEQKLITLRNRQKLNIDNERKRLDEEVDNIKLTHQDQISEIKASQENQLEQMRESHTKTLNNARQKLIQEKSKIETS